MWRSRWYGVSKADGRRAIDTFRALERGIAHMPEYQVVIALGSNQGDRHHTFLEALRKLPQLGIQVIRHSLLYETAPAHVTDQPPFLNAAVLGSTRSTPTDILSGLKHLEREAGRNLLGERWGPRPLDLDIIFYGTQQYQFENLTIPHPRWRERSFVTAPVADLLYDTDSNNGPSSNGSNSNNDRHAKPNPADEQQQVTHQSTTINQGGLGSELKAGMLTAPDLPYLNTDRSVVTRLREARGKWQEMGGNGTLGGEEICRVVPVRGSMWRVGERTRVMGVLNITPDSFSDGGRHRDLEQAVAAAHQMVSEGVDIIDIGGQSTRPGAPRLSAQEELSRVMPVIRALRSDPLLANTPLSVDTFYHEVAREAVKAGVDVVNDVSGGTLDGEMMAEVAKLGVPYVLTHIRGTPETMQQAQHTSYGSVWREVGEELQRAAERAMAAGIAAWNIILDPGIGFAKTATGNLELITCLRDLQQEALQGPFRGSPLLVGVSRKGFLGSITGRKDAADRDAASLAAAVGCVHGGAEIVRVHNVGMTVDGVKVADALYRGPRGLVRAVES